MGVHTYKSKHDSGCQQAITIVKKKIAVAEIAKMVVAL